MKLKNKDYYKNYIALNLFNNNEVFFRFKDRSYMRLDNISNFYIDYEGFYFTNSDSFYHRDYDLPAVILS